MNPNDYSHTPYSRILVPVEGGGFYAEVLEFPGCHAEGESIEAAFQNLEEAAREWIEDCIERGHEVPEPSIEKDYGGQYPLRLPRSIHRRVAKMALREGTSINQLLLSFIAGGLELEDRTSKILEKISERFSPQLSLKTTELVLSAGSHWSTTEPQSLVATSSLPSPASRRRR